LELLQQRIHPPCISELLAGLIPEKALILVFVDDAQP
jgi:DNA primase large subunit